MWAWLQERTHEGGGKGCPAVGEGIRGLVMNQGTHYGRRPLPSTLLGTLKYSPSPCDNCIDTMNEVKKQRETVYSLHYYFLCLLPANYAPGSVKGTGARPEASIKDRGL